MTAVYLLYWQWECDSCGAKFQLEVNMLPPFDHYMPNQGAPFFAVRCGNPILRKVAEKRAEKQ